MILSVGEIRTALSAQHIEDDVEDTIVFLKRLASAVLAKNQIETDNLLKLIQPTLEP